MTDGRRDSGPWNGIIGDPGAEDASYRRGGFIEGLDRFDAKFFGIRTIEARMMDPRQRMLLETSWHALEDAGIDPAPLKGSRAGVFAGLGGSEYRDLIAASGKDDSYLGTAASVAIGRIAFALGLMGPAVPLDMTCAASLVAVHQAAASLRQGEVDLALAGGVHVLLSPPVMRFMREYGMLSKTGQCRTFDAAADGFVRGEGCGMVVLKRLSDAEADGDRIWGVVQGSAVNQNGAAAALTVPNGTAQERLFEEALSQAGIAPSELDYLEVHGTGSELGDPIEVRAVAEVYGRGRDRERPLLLGTVKTNIGHLEAAAGVAGLIKVLLAMQRGVIPKQLHFENPNPHVEWDKLPVRVTSEPTAWPTAPDRPPTAGVSAFGISGTNAHLLVEGYRAPEGDAGGDGKTRLLPLSGKSDRALRDLADGYLSWLDEQVESTASDGNAAASLLADMAWTASTGRSHFEHRAGVIFTDAASLREGLTNVARDGGTPGAAIRGQTGRRNQCRGRPGGGRRASRRPGLRGRRRTRLPGSLRGRDEATDLAAGLPVPAPKLLVQRVITAAARGTSRAPLRTRRETAAGAHAGSRPAACAAHRSHPDPDPDRGDARGRSDGRLPDLGGLCRGGGLRRDHGAAGAPLPAYRLRPRARHEQRGGLHLAVRGGDPARRSGAARDPRGRLRAAAVRAVGANRALQADSHSDRFGNRAHARARHGHAGRLRNAHDRAKRRPGGGRNVKRRRHCPRHRRHRAQGHGSNATVGARHRSGRGHAGRGVVRALRHRSHSRRPWIGIPELEWPGLDLGFGADFWSMIPAFLLLSLIVTLRSISSCVAIQSVSWRDERAVDFRAVQGGINAEGISNLLCGLLGTVPNTTYSISVSLTELTGVAARGIGIATGAIFLLVAFLPKALAVVLAIPAPVVGGYLGVLMAMLFLVGIKVMLQEGLDYRKGLIVGVSFWIGLGFQNGMIFPELVSELAGGLFANAMTTGGLVAIVMTVFVEMTEARRSRMEAELDPASLPRIGEFLRAFAARSGWGDAMADRLEAVGEEALHSLVRPDSGGEAPGRRLRLVAYRRNGGAVLEFAVAPLGQNIQDRLALLGNPADDSASTEQEVSLRLLRHLASSVRHQQYHDVDIVTVQVQAPAR